MLHGMQRSLYKQEDDLYKVTGIVSVVEIDPVLSSVP